MSEDKNKFIALYHFLNKPQDFNFEMNYYEFRDELKTLLDLYQKEKQKNKELETEIREKIEKLNQEIASPFGARPDFQVKGEINLLQELLEERN